MIRIVEGNIIDATEKIIGHQVNCKGVMNSGVAKHLREKFPGLYEAYSKHNYKLLGECQLVVVEDKIIANLFGQINYGYDKAQYTNHLGLRMALERLKKFALESGFDVALPWKIGCGRGGGDWNRVYSYLRCMFDDLEILTLYKLEEKA